jgi:hypothetical protein
VSTRNRVTPFGDIVAIEQRGALLGNRGRLTRGGVLVRPWDGRRWIACSLSFKGWRAPAWGTDGRWTPLFFYDEAVALAAGHRPCALCRRAAYDAWRAAWVRAFAGGVPSAEDMDRRLHADRLDGRVHRRHARSWAALPDGAYVLLDDGRAAAVDGDRLVPWTPAGVRAAVARPSRGDATVLTPSCTVDVLLAGFVPQEAAVPASKR